jgi:hypothetical protein
MRIHHDKHHAAFHLGDTTTLPFARPAPTSATASLVDAKGKIRSTTGRMIPSSMRDAISVIDHDVGAEASNEIYVGRARGRRF